MNIGLGDIIRQISCPARVGIVKAIIIEKAGTSYQIRVISILNPANPATEIVSIPGTSAEKVEIQLDIALHLKEVTPEGAIYTFWQQQEEKTVKILLRDCVK